jgi:hypothetical protein
MEQEYYIYQIVCIPTNRSYIGQTQAYKVKDGKPYHYGIAGRWCDHVSSARTSNAPLHEAIREHGLQAFTQTLLETVSESDADAREAHWIATLNTRVPNGYNATSHSRCKHRATTHVAALYPDATSVEVKHVNRNGAPRLVYVYVDTPTGRKRLTFGQRKTDTFESALGEATAVVDEYRTRGVPIVNPDKRAPFVGIRLKRIRIVPFHQTMVAVYLLDPQNHQTRICFGGKHTPYDDAVARAHEFIRGLETESVEDKSRQQVAPTSGEADPEMEKECKCLRVRNLASCVCDTTI